MQTERKLIIQALKMYHDAFFTPGVYEHSIFGKAALLLEEDAVEVPDKKLLRAIKLLIKQYEHSKNSDYVHSPVEHALFHTWKQLEDRKTDGP